MLRSHFADWGSGFVIGASVATAPCIRVSLGAHLKAWEPQVTGKPLERRRYLPPTAPSTLVLRKD